MKAVWASRSHEKPPPRTLQLGVGPDGGPREGAFYMSEVTLEDLSANKQKVY